MQTIYSSCIDQIDKERIEHIEFLDEANLLEQLLNHYSITVAYKGFNVNQDEDEEIPFGFVWCWSECVTIIINDSSSSAYDQELIITIGRNVDHKSMCFLKHNLL